MAKKTRPGRCPAPTLIALRTLMINQAREVSCQRRFPVSLIYVLIVSPWPAVPSTFMPLPSRSTSAGPPVVLDTALLPCSFLPPAAKETRSDCFCPEMYCCNARCSEDSPNRISLDRHSSLTDLTQRSAYAFRFGLLAGNRSGFTFPVLISSRNDWQSFASRSCSR